MKLKKERVSLLAKKIIEGLVSRGSISPLIPEVDLVKKIEHVITEELMVEDRLNEEVRQILKNYSDQIESGKVNYNRLFQMIKKRLVEERGIVL